MKKIELLAMIEELRATCDNLDGRIRSHHTDIEQAYAKIDALEKTLAKAGIRPHWAGDAPIPPFPKPIGKKRRG